MSASRFSYSVRRAYPYRWFTPITFIGGAILLVLFSLMNFVNNSYVLENQDTKDPNTTIADGVWFKDWPSYLTRSVRPVCQPQSLPMSTQFFTNQTGLLYTITGISGSADGNTQPSLDYFNNILEHCEISQIQVQFDTDGPMSLTTLAGGVITVQTMIKCHIDGAKGSRYITLTTTFSDAFTVFAANANSHISGRDKAAQDWAEDVLTGLWSTMYARLDSIGQKTGKPITKGNVLIAPNRLRGRLGIESLDFLAAQLSIIVNGTNIVHPGDGTFQILKPIGELMEWASTNFDVEILQILDAIAKLIYSIVSVDLGSLQSAQSSNLLTNATATKNLLSAISYVGNDTYGPHGYSNTDYTSGLSVFHKYEWLYTGPVTLIPAVISTSYRCQLPRLKSGGDIFISILVADLVLLSAAWQLFTFGVGWLALDKRARAHHCEGCLAAEPNVDQGIESLPKVTRDSTFSVIDGDNLSSTSGQATNGERQPALNERLLEADTDS